MVTNVLVFPLFVVLLLATRSVAVNDNALIENENSCLVEKLYKSSIPSDCGFSNRGHSLKEGFTETAMWLVDSHCGGGVHLKVLGVEMDAKKCIAECCSQGPEKCQYLWVFETTCIAVGCDTDKASSCKPRSGGSSSSVYVAINHPSSSVTELEKNLENELTVGGTKGKEEDTGDSPPVAATLNDEITITLPTNEVKIFGNNSKDDKGIASYAWKLLSEHFVQPILKDADKSVLHIHNLLPGTYQFSLVVTDTSGQSSRTTVLVRVNNGPMLNDTSTTMRSSTVSTGPTTHAPVTESLATPIYKSEHNTTANIEDEFDYYTKRRNTLKIVIPVLLSLAVVLVVTAAITTTCAYCCHRNKSRMKRFYKYKKLPETIEKT